MRLAWLLACKAAWAQDSQLAFDRTVLGAILTRSKIPFVVGAQESFDVYAAQEFLAGIVESLQKNPSLDFAITTGRKRIHALPVAADAFSALDWWIPVFYSKTANFSILIAQPVPPIPPSTVSLS